VDQPRARNDSSSCELRPLSGLPCPSVTFSTPSGRLLRPAAFTPPHWRVGLAAAIAPRGWSCGCRGTGPGDGESEGRNGQTFAHDPRVRNCERKSPPPFPRQEFGAGGDQARMAAPICAIRAQRPATPETAPPPRDQESIPLRLSRSATSPMKRRSGSRSSSSSTARPRIEPHVVVKEHVPKTR
jgi:hypothetical protein